MENVEKHASVWFFPVLTLIAMLILAALSSFYFLSQSQSAGIRETLEMQLEKFNFNFART